MQTFAVTPASAESANLRSGTATARTPPGPATEELWSELARRCQVYKRYSQELARRGQVYTRQSQEIARRSQRYTRHSLECTTTWSSVRTT